MVIVPVAFIASAPKGADDQPTGQNTTFVFSRNATSELGTYIAPTDNQHYVKLWIPNRFEPRMRH
ncbi:hypothetical protein, partial [Burkholderia vietnamiensis]|uniref:hypothetical protein n=1 Tax=Burkholderia vietnamiensis TaxID=60552 RepID=UPI001B991E8D